MNTICIFAHQDDEIGLAPAIARDVAAGNRIFVAYLTDGRGTGPPAVRERESRSALRNLGVADDDVSFIGTRANIPDLMLVHHLDEAESLLTEALEEWNITRPDQIYCMAWEGGHADHDAAHLIALAIARRVARLDQCYQFYMYNGEGVPGRLFRVFHPIGGEPRSTRTIPLNAAESLRFGFFFRHYPSQWRTWVGLGPEIVFKRCLMRRDILRRPSLEAIQRRPHGGPLLYERMKRMTFEEFASVSAAYRIRLAAN